MRTENTVFISYRRSNIYIARSVYQDLQTHGHDVFLDYQSIDSGSFGRVILSQIAARAHFVLILTPSTLERCVNPGDWVRREIEHAIEMKRNIVPLMFEEFDFGAVRDLMPGKLAQLPSYNSIRIPPDYFEEAMTRLRERFLNKPLEVVLHPVPIDQQQEAEEAIRGASNAPNPTSQKIGAEGHFERGSQALRNRQTGLSISAFNKALSLNPQYPEALNLRGQAHANAGDYDLAIADFSKALAIDKFLVDAYLNRAFVYHMKAMYEEAIADYTEALRLNPANVDAYIGRGDTRAHREDYDRAISDYEEALRIVPKHGSARNKLRSAKRANTKSPLRRFKNMFSAVPDDFKPESAKDYLERGIQRPDQDIEGKIADFTAAIERDPDLTNAYFHRASVLYDDGQFEETISDLTRMIELAPKSRNAYINRAEAYLCLDRWDEAIVDYNHARELNYQGEHVTCGLAIANYCKGWKDDAKAIWDELAEMRLRQYKNANYIGKKLNWHPIIIDHARAMIDDLYSAG